VPRSRAKLTSGLSSTELCSSAGLRSGAGVLPSEARQVLII